MQSLPDAPLGGTHYSPQSPSTRPGPMGKTMSWTMIWGGEENKMSSCCHSQLPACQGSLPPTAQPAPCQGLLPAALREARTPKLLGPPPSHSTALAQLLMPVGLGAQSTIHKQAGPCGPPQPAMGFEQAGGALSVDTEPIEQET